MIRVLRLQREGGCFIDVALIERAPQLQLDRLPAGRRADGPTCGRVSITDDPPVGGEDPGRLLPPAGPGFSPARLRPSLRRRSPPLVVELGEGFAAAHRRAQSQRTSGECSG